VEGYYPYLPLPLQGIKNHSPNIVLTSTSNKNIIIIIRRRRRRRRRRKRRSARKCKYAKHNSFTTRRTEK
jgi:hypothetical protein